MKPTVLFPASYYDISTIEPSFKDEYKAALQSHLFNISFFNFDSFVEGNPLKIYNEGGNNSNPCRVVYRGWMMKPEQYKRFSKELEQGGAKLLSSIDSYKIMHCYSKAFLRLHDRCINSKIRIFDTDFPVEASVINEAFDSFLLKDDVKSAKNTTLPLRVNTPINQAQLDNLISEFKKHRGEQLTGNLIFKQFFELKQYNNDKTNEWRVFYLNGEVMRAFRNSGQVGSSPAPPQDLIEEFKVGMDAIYYTVDFAELADGTWMVLETGDGQVSGLATYDSFNEYYNDFGMRLANISDTDWGHPDWWDFMDQFENAAAESGGYVQHPNEMEDMMEKYCIKKIGKLSKRLGLPPNEELSEEQLKTCLK